MERNAGDALQDTWPRSSGRIRSKWNRLTDNDVKSVDGQSDHLVSRLQERYGWSRERAEHECQAFVDELEHLPAAEPTGPPAGKLRAGKSRGGNGETRSRSESGP